MCIYIYIYNIYIYICVCVRIHMCMTICIDVFVCARVRAYVLACVCAYILYMCHIVVYCLSAETSQTELQMLIAKYPRHVKLKHMEKIKNKSAQLNIICHLAIPMSGKRLLRCEYHLLQILLRSLLRLS